MSCVLNVACHVTSYWAIITKPINYLSAFGDWRRRVQGLWGRKSTGPQRGPGVEPRLGCGAEAAPQTELQYQIYAVENSFPDVYRSFSERRKIRARLAQTFNDSIYTSK